MDTADIFSYSSCARNELVNERKQIIDIIMPVHQDVRIRAVCTGRISTAAFSFIFVYIDPAVFKSFF